MLEPVHDAWLGSLLHSLSRDREIDLLACGNASDHVHLVVRIPPTVVLSTTIGEIKGGSSHAWNHRNEPGKQLAWQDGYWAESLSPSGLAGLERYVARQRIRHARSPVAEPWEEWCETRGGGGDR